MIDVCVALDIGRYQELAKEAIRISLEREGMVDEHISLPYYRLSARKWMPTYRKLVRDDVKETK